MNFAGKTALVTGGSRGIGREIALGLGRGGGRVMVGCRSNRAAAESVVAELRGLGVQAASCAADVADPAGVTAMVEATERELGPVDILINSAGVVYRRPLMEISLTEWEEVLRVNLTGSFLAIQAVVPGMARRHYGRIVNLASSAGRTGGRVASHYAAAKGGLIAMTANLGRELAPLGITINALAPDLTDTEMVEGLKLGPLHEVWVTNSPMGRMARSDEVAAAALFLASAEASFVNGACLDITGGK